MKAPCGNQSYRQMPSVSPKTAAGDPAGPMEKRLVKRQGAGQRVPKPELSLPALRVFLPLPPLPRPSGAIRLMGKLLLVFILAMEQLSLTFMLMSRCG